MKPEERQKFYLLMQNIAKYFKEKLDASTLEFYWEDLHEFSQKDIERAFSIYRRTGKYMPRVCDFLDNLKDCSRDLTQAKKNDRYKCADVHCKDFGTMNHSLGAGGRWVCPEHFFGFDGTLDFDLGL
jgi:hypothetical protein